MFQIFNRFQPFFSSHILLYHATYKEIPNNIKKNLHNVDPETLYKQIKWLKKYFDIVSLEDLFDNQSGKVGKLAVTFDDAYNSVFTEALPILENLKVPSTIYVNAVTLDQKPLWRDKIRYLINNNLINDFLNINPKYFDEKKITINNFYYQTKNNQCNSRQIDQMLDYYLKKNNKSIDEIKFGISDKKNIKKHPLLFYGNHTYNHYVLSSLTKEEQEFEIRENHQYMKKLNINYSKIFSIPFGQAGDLNDETIQLLIKYGYKGFLYSDNKINMKSLYQKKQDRSMTLLSGERYIVKSTYNAFHKHLFKMGIKSLISKYKFKKEIKKDSNYINF